MGQMYKQMVIMHNNNSCESINKAQGSREDRAGNSGQVRKDFTGDQTLNSTMAKIKVGKGAGGLAESIIKEWYKPSMGGV